MPIRRTFEPFILLFGDVLFFGVALWATLLLRYLELPSEALFILHLVPFSLLFLFSVAVYFVAGLYDKQLVAVQERLPQTLFRAHLATVIGGALLFFAVPYFGIAPKTNLFIFLVVSWLFALLWRFVLFPLLARPRREQAVMIGSGSEVEELVRELNENVRSRIRVVDVIGVDELMYAAQQSALIVRMKEERITVCLVDTADPRYQTLLPFFYNLLFLDVPVRYVDLWQMYEEVFDRIPSIALEQGWFMDVFTEEKKWIYLIPKRLFDLCGALVFGTLTLILIPFIFLATRLSGDAGPLFLKQQRIGRYNVPMVALKFRTMAVDNQASDRWMHEETHRVTAVGAVLRRFSIDEFPQVLNIIRGELSLIGPRNDIVGLGARLAEAIPYYNTRYVVLPGISGWAQVNQRYAPGNVSPQSIEETKVRLTYDLYYLKHRSLMLDGIIALKTLRRMFFR